MLFDGREDMALTSSSGADRCPPQELTGARIGIVRAEQVATQLPTDDGQSLDFLPQTTESHAKFRQILDALPSMVWSTRPDGTHDYANQQWQKFVGELTCEIEGNRWLKFVHPDDLDNLASTWQRGLASGEPYEATFRFRHHSGVHRWVCSRGTPQRDDSGAIIRWYGTVNDVHERCVAEQALRASEALTSSVLGASPDCIKLLEADGTILYVNPMGPRALEIDDPVLLLGACWFDLLAPDVAEVARAAIYRSLEGSTEQFVVMQPTAKGSRRWFDIIASPVADGSERPRVVVIARDITREKQSEQALRESEELHRSVLETSSDCIKVLAPDGTIDLVNNRGLAALGVASLDDLRGKNWVDFWPQDSGPTVRKAFSDALEGRASRVTASRLAPNGELQWCDLAITPMKSGEGKVGRVLAVSRDVTSKRKAAERLKWSSEHDALTRLPNRAFFQSGLSDMMAEATAAGHELSLLLVDLDDFKQVNDTLGHDAGDALLKNFAERLQGCVRSSDIVARLGGDEFAVILARCGEEQASAVADKIIGSLLSPFEHDGRLLDCHVSIGVGVFPSHGASPEELLKNADMALYSAKAGGRGASKVFEASFRDEVQKRISMLSLGRKALRDRQIFPYYQPKIDLQTGAVSGFEALLRWHHPLQGARLPGTIAACFEDLHLANEISECIIDGVVADMRAWLDQGLEFGSVAVNAGAAEFRSGNFAESILLRLEQSGVPTSRFQLEVTETVFLGRGAECVERDLKLLAAHGVKIALDDFGTGYASLRHLRQFPVHIIKIDRSFVRDMHELQADAEIVKAVINLGQSLGMEVVAEGIESLRQAAELRQMGCGYGQGFLYAKAFPASQMETYLRAEPLRLIA